MPAETLPLPVLHRRFARAEAYRSKTPYRLLPFRFTALDSRRIALTNIAGDFVVTTRARLRELIERTLPPEDPFYADLVSKGFVQDGVGESMLDLLATQVRTRHSRLADFTALHMFVVTLRCDHSCPYCQVSRVSSDRAAYDMTVETAEKSVDLVFQSPSPRLKVEFQGGEPLLNFEIIRFIVERIKERNERAQRDIAFVVATNLANITDDMLAFFKEHRVMISTSLDGPADLHNANRPRPGGDSYEHAVAGIQRCRETLGHDWVSALMTTTSRALDRPEEIVDEYVRLGFSSIFLRWLSPYGFAARTQGVLGYPLEAWEQFYERGLRHVLRLASTGVPIREDYASIVLRKMLTPYGGSYVDLQSPTGLGIACVVYNYDGDVYASDEGRMLAETGDDSFRLGNVHADRYEDIFLSPRLVSLVADTMTECTPGCADCAFEPWCGTDPCFHQATQGDPVGHRPTSLFCARNMFVFRLLLKILEDEPENAEILRGWA